MMHHPIHERGLKADVGASRFRFQPLVPENFLALRKALPIQQ